LRFSIEKPTLRDTNIAMKKRIKNMIIFLKRLWLWSENIAIIVLISLTFYITIPIKSTSTILLPKGSIGNIISQLTKKGFALSPIDRYILKLMGKPKHGWIEIGKSPLNRIDFLYKLINPRGAIDKITLIPGETMEIFLRDIASDLNLNSDKLIRYYKEFSPYPEAGIYPDTYHLPKGIGERNLIKFLVNQSDKKYKSISDEIYQEYNQTKWLKILIIASIIQKEAANNEEMPIVASVIYNRLKKNMRLQMDGTLNYGIYSHIKVTPKRIREDKTSFNTYKKRGLPHSPIGAVSLTAINSAINPAKTNYLYFMLNSKGTHNFTTTFREHKKNVRRGY